MSTVFSFRQARAALESAICDCPACGDRPQVYGGDREASCEVGFVAHCHGSTERHTVSVQALSDPSHALGALYDWGRGLFRLDALPDVMELIAYNRGKLPRART